ncbi:sensor histidine kinase [Halovenus halobia]|uniref:sensor histidine kinase n=1 Tax=Halovenus halobia TaxID=3396622 RepID=UPI003F54EDEC
MSAGEALGTVSAVTVGRVLLIGASVGLAAVGIRVSRRDTGPVGRPFLVLLGLLSTTALCLGVTAGAGTANKMIWLGTNLAIPAALLAVSCRYYGITFVDSRPRLAGVVAPLVAGGLGGGLIILGTTAQTSGTAAPVGALAGFPPLVYDVATRLTRFGRYYTASLVVVAVGIVAVNAGRYEHLDARLAVALAFGGGWPWLGNFVVPELGAAFGPDAAIGALAGGYVTSLAVAGLAIGPLGLFDSSPAAGNIGPNHALDSMDDTVIITNNEGTVLRLNAVACDRFETTPQASVGQKLSTVVGHSPSALSGETPVTIETADGARQFAVTRSAVTDNRDIDRGTVYVLRDVTKKQNREQRLEVLNRVLRHNLRNDATSIIGRAQLISDGDGGADSAEEIIDTTRDLVGVAESARDIDQMMAATQADKEVELDPIVQRVTETIGSSYPAVEVTTAVPADTTVAASKQVIETILRELLENAAEHNDADQPYAIVSAERTGNGSVTLAVSDNGPGVPDHERAVLDAGEDQLQHGSGLGLWAVHWGVTRLGGKLAISENTPRGTTVTVTLPTTSASESTPAVPEQAES